MVCEGESPKSESVRYRGARKTLPTGRTRPPVFRGVAEQEDAARDSVNPHATTEMKRVAPDVIAVVEQGPRSIAGSSPASPANLGCEMSHESAAFGSRTTSHRASVLLYRLTSGSSQQQDDPPRNRTVTESNDGRSLMGLAASITQNTIGGVSNSKGESGQVESGVPGGGRSQDLNALCEADRISDDSREYSNLPMKSRVTSPLLSYAMP